MDAHRLDAVLRASQRRVAFMRATKGADPYTVAQAVSALTPGVDWRCCSRGHIADAFAVGRDGLSQLDLKGLMTDITRRLELKASMRARRVRRRLA